ncbi:hypothetical protein N8Y93_02300 [Litorivicinus sp.]|nr:hypothetical protein [Litorivicinus sp.]
MVNKLSQTYLKQVAALDKHRGGASQKVVVEHVTVGDGGQAIVGNVTSGKPKKESRDTHAQYWTHASRITVWGEDTVRPPMYGGTGDQRHCQSAPVLTVRGYQATIGPPTATR